MRFLSILAVVLCCAAAPMAQAQIGFGFGIGTSPFGRQQDNIRIGAVARGHIEAYLKAEYQRLCQNKKEPPPVCAEQRPYYKSSFMPERGAALDPALASQVGFVYPGTEYRQIGFSVYLVGLPNRRIHDVVSIWSDGWN